MYHKLTDKEWLRTEYVDKLRTLQSIGDEIGCNKATVGRTLKKYGIGRRKHTSKHAKLNDKAWLRKAYVDDNRTIASLAREIGCTVGPVRDAIIAQGIKTRNSRIVANEGPPRFADRAGNWQGGRRRLETGYVYVYAPNHLYSTKAGYVMEHRLVMEKELGRLLEPGEVVHHINGKKDDNRPENLEVKTKENHISEHFKASHEVTKLRKENEELKAKLALYEEKYGLLD